MRTFSRGGWKDPLTPSKDEAAIPDRLLHPSMTVNNRRERYRLKERTKAGLLSPPPSGERTAWEPKTRGGEKRGAARITSRDEKERAQ